MNDTKKNHQAMSLTVTEGVTVSIIPNQEHEFLIDTKQVAMGYGVSDYAVRKAFLRKSSELREGKHYVKGGTFCPPLPNSQPNQVFWTKRGVVRLGFFITSQRAQIFRDLAEDLIIEKMNQQTTLFDVSPTKHLKGKGKFGYNRLTPDRLISILQDVCMIEDKELRVKIANKLKGGNNG